MMRRTSVALVPTMGNLHDGHLKRLAAYSAQFVFVLNQADRLTDDARVAVLDGHRAALPSCWRSSLRRRVPAQRRKR